MTFTKQMPKAIIQKKVNKSPLHLKLVDLEAEITSMKAQQDELKHSQAVVISYLKDLKGQLLDEQKRLRSVNIQPELFTTRELIEDEIKSIDDKIQPFKADLIKIKTDQNNLREQINTQMKSSGLKDAHNIEAQIERINNDLKTKRTTAKEFDSLVRKKEELMKKLEVCGVLKDLRKENADLNERYSEVKEQLNLLFKQYNERKDELMDLKGHINMQREKSNEKTPLILSLEEQIRNAEAEKEEFSKTWVEVNDVIKRLYDEKANIKHEIQEAKRMSGMIYDQERKIKEKEALLARLIEEKKGLGCSIYDLLIGELSLLKEFDGLDLKLVSELIAFGLSIPRSKEECAKVIVELKKRKKEDEKKREVRMENLDGKILALEQEIGEEKGMLKRMREKKENEVRK